MGKAGVLDYNSHVGCIQFEPLDVVGHNPELVLQRGKIVERDTHQELLALQGLYNKLYLLQQGNGG